MDIATPKKCILLIFVLLCVLRLEAQAIDKNNRHTLSGQHKLILEKKEITLTNAISFSRFATAKIWTKINSENDIDYVNITLFDKITQLEELNYGGGIETPVLVAGTYYEHGVYDVFDDVSNLRAWSSTLDGYTRWSIRGSPTTDPSWGVQMRVPSKPLIFSRWNMKRDSLFSLETGMIKKESSIDNSSSEYKEGTENKKYNNSYFWGANIGSELYLGTHINWHPRVLYRYTYRDELPSYTYNWNSWEIGMPTALKLHQFGLYQFLSYKNWAWMQVLGKYERSDTKNGNYSGLTRIGGAVGKKKIDWTLQVSYADAESITQEWKYQQYLWSLSAQTIYFYMRGGNIKIRGEIAEYNQHESERAYPQSLRKSYSFHFQHRIAVHKKTVADDESGNELLSEKQKELAHHTSNVRKIVVEFVPEFDFAYLYAEDEEYYKVGAEQSVYHGAFSHTVSYREYLYVEEKSRDFFRYKHLIALKTNYKLKKIGVRLGARADWEMLVPVDYPAEITGDYSEDFAKSYEGERTLWDDIYLVTKVFSISPYLQYTIGGFQTRIVLKYKISENNDVSDKKEFLQEPFLTISCQYKW